MQELTCFKYTCNPLALYLQSYTYIFRKIIQERPCNLKVLALEERKKFVRKEVAGVAESVGTQSCASYFKQAMFTCQKIHDL